MADLGLFLHRCLPTLPFQLVSAGKQGSAAVVVKQQDSRNANMINKVSVLLCGDGACLCIHPQWWAECVLVAFLCVCVSDKCVCVYVSDNFVCVCVCK